ncbi:hypothetical protein ACFQ58_10460 [Agromyces sp. NPDC056523]|uniref:hypothetical protein n=1 Tax=Agromyces sp. NPDC056523 TaxID=3345850 RepID=UPI00366CA6D8
MVAAALASIAAPVSASAADFELVFEAGTACEFELRVGVTAGSAITRQFTDSEGNIVRTLTAGRGNDLTFTNAITQATVSLRGNGSVTSTTLDADGTSTVRSTGHNVVILYPSDVPAGPSTTLYVGRVTYEIDAQAIFTITGSSGRTRDICDELS